MPNTYENPNKKLQVQGLETPASTTPPNTISAADLSSPSKLTLPALPPSPLPDYSRIAISTPAAPPVVANTPEQDQLQAERAGIVGDITATNDKLGTKSARQAELENQAGIPVLNTQLNELNNLIRQTQSEAFAATQKSEDRLAPTFAITGEQAQIERQRAVKVYGWSAAAEAIQGNIALANDHVGRALAAEFDPLEREIDNKKFLLSVNMDNFNAEEKRRAEKQQIVLDEYKQQIAQQRADRENILQVMLEAAQNGADNLTLNRIQNAKTPEEATTLAGSALGSAFRMKQEQQAFENNLAIRNMALNEAQVRLSQNKFAFEKQQANADIHSGVLTDKDIQTIDNSPQGKKLKSLGDLKMKATAYQELVKKYGTASFGKQKAILDASFADLKIAYKTAAELGALQGPDIALLQEALRPATFDNPLTQAFAKLTGSGKGAIDANLTQAIKTIDSNAETNITQLLARNPKYANSNYVQSLALPFMKPDSAAVTIGGQSVPVGTIIQNAQGQRGRVNADGTITPL